jgi:hypothetical protein
MSRTLNGAPLPDDCTCLIAVIVTSVNVGGHLRPSSHGELRPLQDCPHHGDDPTATDGPSPGSEGDA